MSAISEFLSMYPDKKNTIQTYRSALIDYFTFIYGFKRAGKRATQEETARYEDLAGLYVKEIKSGERDHIRDIERYAVNMNSTPPKTKIVRVAAIKEFLRYNRINFEDADKKIIKQRLGRKNRAQTKEIILTKEIIQSIIAHTDARGRAFILFMVSSGMRIGEALNLLVSDVDLTRTPAK
ncbi:MAG: site-specific integrase, partial [Methanoregulaceae archaeon]|nr:site-specific integrase [Methanoregulaceae archaeon]